MGLQLHSLPLPKGAGELSQWRKGSKEQLQELWCGWREGKVGFLQEVGDICVREKGEGGQEAEKCYCGIWDGVCSGAAAPPALEKPVA